MTHRHLHCSFDSRVVLVACSFSPAHHTFAIDDDGRCHLHDCSNFEDEERAALMYAELPRCTRYTRRAALTKGKPQEIEESPSSQPISGPVIFSKRQALSRAVVVNSNMSRGKYLAREGPGSRLAHRSSSFPSLFEIRLMSHRGQLLLSSCLSFSILIIHNMPQWTF